MSGKLILIAGPTASGKSSLGINLAKKINGEIINADSMQVYKEFSVLSSRPKKKDLTQVKHHLYGFISVKDHFSAGTWLNLLKKTISKCVKNKKIPIVLGGSGLYFNTITMGISKIPHIDSKTRIFVRNLHKEIGQTEFYKKLLSIDPLAEKKFSSTDTHRSMRAFEVKIYTKKSLYEWVSKTKSDFLNFDIKKFYIDIPKEDLLTNISKRTENMFSNKCINEVRKFIKIRIDRSLSANKLIGVKEIRDYLNNLNSLEKTKELINIKTRQYAKRQNTWSRGHMKNWNKIYSKNLSILTKKILKEIS
ncbi:MAG: tRNA (adenosine(37)-N6)-dimethylallyltransferase MiaA [Pelagibacteraceae bacterium]